MKIQAQAILQFTGYPLEPIVALHINKTFELQLAVARSTRAAHAIGARKKETGSRKK